MAARSDKEKGSRRCAPVDWITPCERGGFLERSGNGTIFFVAKLDGAFNGGFLEPASEAVEDFQFGPHRGRLWRALAGADDFEGFELLALFLEDDDHVGGGASAERQEKQLRRAGSLVGLAVRIDCEGVTRRAGGNELLSADPFHGCSLYLASGRNSSVFSA